jgi:nucleotide-binding universal stress UspA family protein
MITAPTTIAVGFDGSSSATTALRWALALATPLRARVVVVHAAGLLSRLEPVGAHQGLEDAVRRVGAEFEGDLDFMRFEVDEGDACSVLLRAAHDPINADLVVVGSRGHGVHEGLMLGSTSLQLAERSSIPIVIVPSGRPGRTTGFGHAASSSVS